VVMLQRVSLQLQQNSDNLFLNCLNTLALFVKFMICMYALLIILKFDDDEVT